MPDDRIEFRHPRDRDLATVYAVLWSGTSAVDVASTALVAIEEADWADLAIPLTDADVPYLYAADPPSGTPVGRYALEVYEGTVSGQDVVYDIDDVLVGQGSYASPGTPDDSLPTGLAEMKATVERMLGGGAGGVDVEVTDAAFADCLRAALRELNRWRPPHGFGTVTTVANAPMHLLAKPGMIGVVDVVSVDPSASRFGGCGCPLFPEDQYGFIDSLGLTGYYGPGLVGSPETLADYVMAATYVKTARMLSSSDFSWRAVDGPTPGTVYLLFDGAPSGSKVVYEYTWGVTADDDATTGVSRIPAGDLNWVLDYAKAKAKQVLGAVRRKFSMNLPGGNTEPLDGGDMMTEGREEEAALVEAIRRRRRLPAPIQG